MYQWIGGDEPSDVASAAQEQVDAGFTALKMNATPEIERVDNPATVEAAATRLREVREAVGPEVDIGVDFHGRVSKPMGKRLASALEPYEPMFIEEPVFPEHNDVLPAIAHHTTIPIATGERMYSRWDFKQVFENGAVDLVQPDLSHAGGITEVTDRVDGRGLRRAMAPHCPLGPVALASCVQVDACSPNALIQEQSLNIHYNQRTTCWTISKTRVRSSTKTATSPFRRTRTWNQMDEQYIRKQARSGQLAQPRVASRRRQRRRVVDRRGRPLSLGSDCVSIGHSIGKGHIPRPIRIRTQHAISARPRPLRERPRDSGDSATTDVPLSRLNRCVGDGFPAINGDLLAALNSPRVPRAELPGFDDADLSSSSSWSARRS